MRCFNNNPSDNLEKVAEEAGVSRRTLHRYFEIPDNFLSNNVHKHEMTEVKESGHFLQEKKPEQIVRSILDFLN